jgi:hypothetical protein
VCGDPNAGPPLTCGCKTDLACSTEPDPGLSGCGPGGLCMCDGLSCVPGEVCKITVGTGGALFGPVKLQTCSCAGGPACPTGPIIGTSACCPSGCKNVGTDELNCGACGRRCPPGFICNGDGTCVCDTDSDCVIGTCVGGACKCPSNAVDCGAGERCVLNGSCG